MLKELIAQRAELEAQMASLQEQMQAINIDIESAVANQIGEVRRLQAKEFGAVNVTIDGIKVTETVTKKVEWDQEKMTNLFKAIQTAGDDPFDWMKVKLEVGEKQYEAFNTDVKAMFADCRSVKPGKPALKFEVINA